MNPGSFSVGHRSRMNRLGVSVNNRMKLADQRFCKGQFVALDPTLTSQKLCNCGDERGPRVKPLKQADGAQITGASSSPSSTILKKAVTFLLRRDYRL